MSESYGPIVVLHRNLDEETAARFREELTDHFGRLQTEDGIGIRLHEIDHDSPFATVLDAERTPSILDTPRAGRPETNP